MLLDGDLEWQSLAIDPEKMQFIEIKNSVAREICFGLGVPPQLLGIPGDNTYANYAEANKAFYRQTVIPLTKKFLNSLSGWLLIKEKVHLVVDLDKIDALADERAAHWDRVNTASFLTTNEKRESVGYDDIEDPAADEVLINATQVPLTVNPEDMISGGGADTEYEDDGAETGTGEGDQEQEDPENGNKPAPQKRSGNLYPIAGRTRAPARTEAKASLGKTSNRRR
jgi:hypothetical protein